MCLLSLLLGFLLCALARGSLPVGLGSGLLLLLLRAPVVLAIALACGLCRLCGLCSFHIFGGSGGVVLLALCLLLAAVFLPRCGRGAGALAYDELLTYAYAVARKVVPDFQLFLSHLIFSGYGGEVIPFGDFVNGLAGVVDIGGTCAHVALPGRFVVGVLPAAFTRRVAHHAVVFVGFGGNGFLRHIEVFLGDDVASRASGFGDGHEFAGFLSGLGGLALGVFGGVIITDGILVHDVSRNLLLGEYEHVGTLGAAGDDVAAVLRVEEAQFVERNVHHL